MSEKIQTYKEHLQEQVASDSPEGRPAHPTVGPRSFGVILILIALMFVVLGIVFAILVQPIAAIAFAGLGLIVFAANPQVWTALLRGKERAKIDQDQERSVRA